MEYEGDSQVKAVKLQGLRRDFENLSMKEVVEKILRSLTPKFDFVVLSIEVAYDLSTLTPVKLMGCLQSQEERIKSRTPEKQKVGDEQALQAMYDPTRTSSFRGRGRLSFRGRGRGRSQDKPHEKYKIPHCTHCNKYGHVKSDCWYNNEPTANVAKENEEGEDEEKLFMAITEDHYSLMTNATDTGNTTHLWFLDSGASNHMTGCKKGFTHLDESFKMVVKLGDKKELIVQGKGTIKIITQNGNSKLLDDVYYAPLLGYNLLSVGQLM
ncbi:uncharacterized protein LOC143536554 [Bidens hawaiensis]|uniref:uncharacterized protein LOC143536554 n=1 Tax=Bidens hawaiensis TaxID=980011 RepID=UPI00404B2BBC